MSPVGASLLAMLLTYKDRQQELGVPLAPTQFAARQRSVEDGATPLIKKI
jgi:hypothetical protein